ncbi:DUF4153 domain-containing protein [Palleronia sediminis]|uniref:DUF4153 domain-containing protein n=1 Tax=Palleronia sediminis TaxID=2547833 RepID=A0A4R6A7M8_9RHOB|nr:DUF4153 domain-containing protein [Palleronia sediminis]TDL79680.1 DUF4153 domain-containing protein [Palleronia sediminis]
MTGPSRPSRARAIHISLGAGLGALASGVDHALGAGAVPARFELAALAAFAAFALGLFAMIGRAPLARGGAIALAAAALAGGAAIWAGLRYAPPVTLPDRYVPLVIVLIALPLPHLVAMARRDDPLSPAVFHDEAAALCLRGAAAAAFTALVWGVIALSDALLGLVGVDLLDLVAALPAGEWMISGAAAALALSTLGARAPRIGRSAAGRLVPLLVPAALFSTGVFLLALPLRGLSGLFDGVSAGAVLMATVATLAVLIAVALGGRPEEAVAGRAMPAMVRLLAATIPILAICAALAIGVRVGAYGWTPARVTAAAGVAVALVWGAACAWAVLRPGGWAHRLRRVQPALVLAAPAAALALMTVISPEAISARSQVARGAVGTPPLDARDRRAIAGWGRAGASAARSIGPAPDGSQPDWPEALAIVGDRAAAQSLMAGNPELSAEVVRACAIATPQGRPGCVLATVRIDGAQGPAAVLGLARTQTTAEIVMLGADDREWRRAAADPVPLSDLDALHRDGVTPTRREIDSLKFGSTDLLLLP